MVNEELSLSLDLVDFGVRNDLEVVRVERRYLFLGFGF